MPEYEPDLDEIVICKYCEKPVQWGDMIWKNGKCMCPQCYLQEEENMN